MFHINMVSINCEIDNEMSTCCDTSESSKTNRYDMSSRHLTHGTLTGNLTQNWPFYMICVILVGHMWGGWLQMSGVVVQAHSEYQHCPTISNPINQSHGGYDYPQFTV